MKTLIRIIIFVVISAVLISRCSRPTLTVSTRPPKDMFECDSYKNGTKHTYAECMLYFVNVKQTVDNCDSIEAPYKNDCTFNLAVRNNNINWCYTITDWGIRETCLNETATNLSNMALGQNKPELCDKIPSLIDNMGTMGYKKKNSCYFNFALKYKSSDLCYKMIEPFDWQETFENCKNNSSLNQ